MNKNKLLISKMGAFTLLSVACLTIMVGCVITPSINEIALAIELKHSPGLLVTLPSLGVVVFGISAGRFIDSIGAYIALCIGLFFYGLLGAIGALIYDDNLLLIDRFVLGGACALVMTSGTTLISYFYSGPKRLKMIAIQGMSIEIGGVIFLSIGGVLGAISWRWPFVLYLMAWLFLIMVLLFVPKPLHHAITKSPDILSKTLSNPLRRLQVIFFAALSSMVLFFVGIIIIPQRFHLLHINTANTGFFLAFLSLVAVGAASQMPKFVVKFSAYKTLFMAFLSYMVGLLIYSIASTFWFFVPGAIFMGIGFGLSIPLVNHMIVEESPSQYRGRNLAYLAMAIYLGQFMSSFIDGISNDSQIIFIGTAILAILMAIIFFYIDQNKRDKA